MIILVRVRDTLGRCRIPGYQTGWFEADEVKYGLDNSRSLVEEDFDDEAEGSGTVTPQKLEIKKALDSASCDLMFHGMRGQVIPSIEIQMVETAKGGVANFPFLLLRFEKVLLTKWSLNLRVEEATEDAEFDYLKVAMEYHSTSDGIDYNREATRGWDLTAQADGHRGKAWDYRFKLRGDRQLASGSSKPKPIVTPPPAAP